MERLVRETRSFPLISHFIMEDCLGSITLWEQPAVVGIILIIYIYLCALSPLFEWEQA